MEYRRLGLAGLRVSPICLGTMQFGWTADESTGQKVLSAAYEAGINFLDTADIYSNWAEGNPGGVSEEIIGRWIKQCNIPRDRIVVATKLGNNMGGGLNDEGLSRHHVMKAAEESLRRLQTDYLDLYQTHSPDDKTPIEETLRAFDDLVRQGKVRYIGASNYFAWQMMQALWTSDRYNLARFDSLQPQYNLLHREEFEREVATVCRTYNIGVIPYSPLAAGFLTGKYHRNFVPKSARADGLKHYFNERNWKLLDILGTLAKEKSATISQISLAWLLADPVITSLIIGANSIEQLRENLGALDVHLTPDEKSDLDKATTWKADKE